MDRPRLLDLFCGAGGCSVGYHWAGFDVTGVDHRPQPRYPFAFVQADALEYVAEHGREFDAIHASPPCQRYSNSARVVNTRDRVYPDLVAPTREMLNAAGRSWVIENVPGAPLSPFSAILCGTMFGLGVRRHRLFEAPFLLLAPSNPCHHRVGDIGIRSERATLLGTCARQYRTNDKRPGRSGLQSKPIETHVATAKLAMGIDWMTLRELGQAIPPAYTEFVGRQLLAVVHGTAEKDFSKNTTKCC